MERHGDARDGSIGASLKATYRALLARGLEAGEAANLTAFLHGLPSEGFHWTLPQIEAVILHRMRHAADQRRAALLSTSSSRPRVVERAGRTIHDRRRVRGGSTHVIDPPTA